MQEDLESGAAVQVNYRFLSCTLQGRKI